MASVVAVLAALVASDRALARASLSVLSVSAASPSEVMFADTYDRIGPLGAKSQGECAINPVAPAIANALADATGVRFAHLPLTPDRIYDRLGDAA